MQELKEAGRNLGEMFCRIMVVGWNGRFVDHRGEDVNNNGEGRLKYPTPFL